MLHLAPPTLGAALKSFGGRIFELTRALDTEPARAARRAAAEASRAFTRAGVAGEARLSRRALEIAFRALGDAVRALDAIAAAGGETSVPASALAAEGAGLSETAFDLLG